MNIGFYELVFSYIKCSKQDVHLEQGELLCFLVEIQKTIANVVVGLLDC